MDDTKVLTIGENGLIVEKIVKSAITVSVQEIDCGLLADIQPDDGFQPSSPAVDLGGF